MPGADRREDLKRAAQPARLRLAAAGGLSEPDADRNSEAPPAASYGANGKARERRPGGTPAKASGCRPWKGRTPREQPAVGALNQLRPPGTLVRVKAQKPRPAGPARWPSQRAKGLVKRHVGPSGQ